MKTHKKKILVIGHKNPDTDSICSSIAYTALKNQISPELHVAKCAGEINAETEFVLRYFGVDKPDYIDDVSTQVKDIDIHEVPAIDSEMSLKDAWSLMRKDRLYTLPICNEEQNLEGLITNSDIAHVIMDLDHTDILATSKTPYDNILRTLNATLITGKTTGRYVEGGKVCIAGDNPEIMEDYIKPGDIVILGNRYDCQLCAIEMEASCIVICEGTKVAKTIQKMADANNCVVMVSPYDTFTVARLINQSMPVRSFMTMTGLFTFQTDDFIDEIKNIMAKKRFRDFPILDHKGHYQGMISRRNLMDMTRKRIILVDHNEAEQAVDGIKDAEILEIIDHHRLGNITTRSPMFFRNQPVGCTATIIYGLYKEYGAVIDKTIAGLLVSAIISDTLMFKSPTCTDIDRKAAEDLSNIAEIDIDEYAEQMFSAGSNLHNKSAEEIFYQDYKKFTVGDSVLGVGQINSISNNELIEIEEKIVSYINEVHINKGADLLFFMLTDVRHCSTKLLFAGDKAKELVNEAFGVDASDGSVVLEGIVSRKKQFIPSLMVALQY
ncbi:MAG: putative manganese-dependent inorganic diphosphatase [Lachnospiraceae bacterium]